MKKKWEWSWGPDYDYVHVSHSWFLGTIVFIYALINPQGFGHWIGNIVHAVKEAI